MSRSDRFAKCLPAASLLLAAALLVSCGGEESAAAPGAAVATDTAAPATDIDSAMAPEPAAAEPVAQTASDAAPAYIGTWGVDLAQCAIAQEYEQPPMILRADGYDQHEAHCDFDSVTETGPSQWHVTGQCIVEGDEQPIDENYAIIDGHLEHWAGDERQYAWTLVRCPE
tara:strand:+ start:13984 stop:14493 length:510 start_codon:yes stop_codon:yes gene_type:complete